jgi:hypothetical protein
MDGTENRNKRAAEMWVYISESVDFEDMSVLDLGSGYGDLMRYALDAGAVFVAGVEHDYVTAAYADSMLQTHSISTDNYAVVVDDIDRIVRGNDKEYTGYDIIICNSVLPYLESPADALEWIQKNSNVAIIECQYNGDGPGPEGIRNDEDMYEVLQTAGWQHVKKIGWTDVMIRPAKRSIWKCYG